MTATLEGPWQAKTVYERSVMCPGDCGYMAIERNDGTRTSGLCTKCGKIWSKAEVPEIARVRSREQPEDDPDLRKRVLWQNGSEVNAGDDEAFNAAWDTFNAKCRWAGEGFGAAVEVRFKDGPTERGYLTALEGFSDPETDGVVHLPHTWGDKEDGGPVWITLLDCARLEDVEEIRIGRAALRSHEQGEFNPRRMLTTILRLWRDPDVGSMDFDDILADIVEQEGLPETVPDPATRELGKPLSFTEGEPEE